MLRVSDPEAIRNPQLYLYTVASNLLKEHAVLEQRQANPLDLDEASLQQRLGELSALDSELEAKEMTAALNAALERLPSRWPTLPASRSAVSRPTSSMASCDGTARSTNN